MYTDADQCPVGGGAGTEQDVLSDNNKALLLGGVIGSALLASAAILAMALLLRSAPVEGMIAQGLGGDAPAFMHNSEIFEASTQSHSNAAFDGSG